MYRFMLHMYMQVQVLTILFYILAPRPLLNTITKDEFNMETQVTINVPEGLRSICYHTKLKVVVHNNRTESDILLWWVNYQGNAVLYSTITPGAVATQLSYGTHPWLISETNGGLITYFVPLTDNVAITVE